MRRIRKQYTEHYTVIDNQILNDTKISFAARGLFSYLWAQADTFDFYVSAIVKQSDKDGRTKVQNYIDELEERGYLKRTEKRVKGQFSGYEWLLSDHRMIDDEEVEEEQVEQKVKSIPVEPQPENIEADKTDNGLTVDEKTATVNQQLISTKKTSTKEINTNNNKYQYSSLSNINTESIKHCGTYPQRKREKDIAKDDFLATMVVSTFAKDGISVSDREFERIAVAVAHKDAGDVRGELDKTSIFATSYPVGFFISCVNNLPDAEVA